MRENDNYQPIDALFEAITECKPGTVSADDLTGSIEIKIGRSLIGQERTDIHSLAEQELAFYADQSEPQPLRPNLLNMNEEEWRD